MYSGNPCYADVNGLLPIPFYLSYELMRFCKLTTSTCQQQAVVVMALKLRVSVVVRQRSDVIIKSLSVLPVGVEDSNHNVGIIPHR